MNVVTVISHNPVSWERRSAHQRFAVSSKWISDARVFSRLIWRHASQIGTSGPQLARMRSNRAPTAAWHTIRATPVYLFAAGDDELGLHGFFI